METADGIGDHTYEDAVVALTARLAAIDSVNPDLVPGAAGESEVAAFVAEWGAERGFEVHMMEVAPGRPNVVLVRRGSGGGRSLLCNGHLDTVGARGEHTTEVRIEGERLYGRGVLDTKGGLAAAMVAAASFASGELAGDLMVAAVVDEENGSIGTEALVREWRPDAAIVLEPTDLAVISQHRGFAVIEVHIVGRSAHTSRAERGANAVHAAGAVIDAVQAVDARWTAAEPDPIARPSAMVNSVRSNGELFTVPAACAVTVEMRTTGTNPHEQVEEVIESIRAASPLVVDCAVTLSRPPLAQHDDHPFVQAVIRAVAPEATQPSGSRVGMAAPYWTDAALHSAAGTPAVVFGPVGEGLHEDIEWVTIDSLHTCVATLRSLVLEWCGAAVPAMDS